LTISCNYLLCFLGCWSAEPHDRPSFRELLALLDDISKSEFVTTTHESFREIQEDWHREIEEMFDELRTKEKVISCSTSSQLLSFTIQLLNLFKEISFMLCYKLSYVCGRKTLSDGNVNDKILFSEKINVSEYEYMSYRMAELEYLSQ